VTDVRVAIARAWGVSPIELRGLTLGEYAAMGRVLAAEAAEYERRGLG
jgi:hypothetical protein